MNIIIAGGTGAIGRKLSTHLKAQGHHIRILSRAASRKDKGVYHWNPDKQEIDNEVFDNCQMVINLCGSPILPKLWTKKRKAQLRSSRIDSTAFLAKQLKEHPVDHFVQISAVGIYGDGGEEILDEDSSLGNDFLATLCRDWEDAARCDGATRPIILRLGLYFEKNKGFYAINKKLGAWGLSTAFGNGKQFISYTHEQEFFGLIESATKGELTPGVYNAVSFSPLRLKEFVQRIARFRLVPFIPRFVLRLFIGETADPLLFSSRVISKRQEIIDRQIFRDHEAAFKALDEL